MCATAAAGRGRGSHFGGQAGLGARERRTDPILLCAADAGWDHNAASPELDPADPTLGRSGSKRSRRRRSPLTRPSSRTRGGQRPCLPPWLTTLRASPWTPLSRAAQRQRQRQLRCRSGQPPQPPQPPLRPCASPSPPAAPPSPPRPAALPTAHMPSTVRRSTRFVTQLDSHECLGLLARAIAADTFPLPPPFSSVPQRLRVDLEAHSATVFWGGVVAAEVQVYLLEEEEEGEGGGGAGSTAPSAASSSACDSNSSSPRASGDAAAATAAAAAAAAAVAAAAAAAASPAAGSLSSTSRSVASVASPLLRGMAGPQGRRSGGGGGGGGGSSASASANASPGAAAGGSKGELPSRPLILVEFRKGPAADALQYKRLWSRTRRYLETELRGRQAQ